ncbi:MAG: polysaccharide biosynthesis tyrosine autokinase [Bacteroidia bacterium]|nr:polysaccharide biosynthesis tyrosine autokinase [Bacteroidia bacterium]
MTDQDQIKLYKDQIERTIDINRVISVILRRWYVLLIAIVVALSVAFLILRYTKPLYTASVQLKIEDDKGNNVGDLFRYGRISGRIENQLKTESEIFKSRTLALNTIKNLGYNIAYFQKGQIVTSELYPFNYFKVMPLYLDSADYGVSYSIKFINPTTFILKSGDKQLGPEININDSIILGSSVFKVTTPANGRINTVIGNEIIFRINNPFNEAMAMGNNIEVDVEKGTSILKLTYISDIPEKAADFVNATAKTYIQENINSRSQSAEKTVEFIDGLIVDLAGQVDNAQQNITDFQTANSGVQLEDIGQAEFIKLTELETQKSMLLLKKKIMSRLGEQINTAKDQTLELVLLDPEDAQDLPRMLELLNGLILDRLSLSLKTLPTSPVMIENEKKIKEVKQALTRALLSAQEKVDERIAYTNKLINQATAKLESLPQKQQALLNLERNFKVNEKIYGYLMEKKLETRISKSSILANASIIDQAIAPYYPFYPVPGRVYAIAFMIGLALGTAIIFLLRFIYNRIPDKETIEALSETPVIGVIKKLNDDEMEENYELYVMKSPKSIFSESIRGIRTNVNFILKGGIHKIVCVTSSVSGEGKTFSTVNLAASLTLLGHKVIIVGCDLRRPKIHLTFRNITNDIGLTTFLIGKHELKDIIQESEFENLDVITAGPTPPNPSELLNSDKMEALVAKLKQDYDYVFFDTAPVGLVSDSFALMSKADINLFIIRSQYSRRDFAMIPDRLKEDNQIPNMYIILNSYDNSSAFYGSVYKSAYGGYYGGGGYYYYGGYYNNNSYYNRKYYSQYYNGYYSDETTPRTWWQKLVGVNKKRKKNKA